LWIALSRAAVAVSSVLNWSLLLRLVAPDFRGRVSATNESLVRSTMMLSMLAASIASQHVDPRAIGAVSGIRAHARRSTGSRPTASGCSVMRTRNP
jgi:hypothetical protein